MSSISNREAVKRWRQNTKIRIVNAMGNRCCICGYNKCNSALALHHLDPSQKELSFGAMRANPKRWSDITSELKKCVLVCHNCHSEIHAGLIDHPLTSTFDDRFLDYDYAMSQFNTNECKSCGKAIPDHYETCSYKCSRRIQNTIDWTSINLEKELETKSFTAIAYELNISNAAVSKRAKKLGLSSRFGNVRNIKLCPVCGNEIGHRSITCSSECAAKRREIVAWDTIDLECELKHKSYVQIGRELGVSDNAVRKRAKKLGLI